MRCVTASLLLLALMFAASGFWIQAKAQFGQLLLESAWKKTLAKKTYQKPWPWADTWPVAKLRVPSMDKSLIVLEGVSGEAMAFGPGKIITTSANNNFKEVTAIGGHRDSHMQFLEHINQHAVVELQHADGSIGSYRISDILIADSATEELMVPADKELLVLITCYPFNALQTGGSLRYIVLAEPEPTLHSAVH